MNKTIVLLVLVVLTLSCFLKQTEAKPYLRLSRAFNRGLMMGAMASGLGGSGRRGGGGRTYIMPMSHGGYGGGNMMMMIPHRYG